MYENKIDEVEKFFKENKNVVLVQHNLDIIEGTNPTKEEFLSAMAIGDVWKEWHTKNRFPTFTPTAGISIRRKSLLKIIPVPSHLRHSADSFVTRSVITQGEVFSIFKSLGGYRRHGENAVHGNEGHDSTYYFLTEVAPYLDKFYKRNNLPSQIGKLPSIIVRTTKDKILDLSIRKILRILTKYNES